MSNWNARGNRGNDSYNNSYNRDRGPASDRDGPKQRFRNSGSLWPQEGGASNGPDMKGSVSISDEVLDYLIREAQNGPDVVLEIATWRKMTHDNRNFQSIRIDIPYRIKLEMEGNPTYRPSRPNFNRRQEERQPYQPQRQERQGYAQQSGRTDRGDNRFYRQKQQDDDFARGDRMPDFLRDDDDDNEPPF